MVIKHNFTNFFFLSMILCAECVPIRVQVAESEELEVAGFVGPLVIDEKEFDHQALRRVYKPSVDQDVPDSGDLTFGIAIGDDTYHIRNCKCFDNARIVRDKLVVTHSYGGGESNRESTKLLWNGTYHTTSKGEYMVDVILYSEIVDMRRALITEKKVIDITKLQRNDVNGLLINIVGYDRLIRYEY